MSSRKHYVDLWGFFSAEPTRPSALFLDDKQREVERALEKDADAYLEILIIEETKLSFLLFSQFLCLDQENNVMSLPVQFENPNEESCPPFSVHLGSLRYIPRYPLSTLGNHQACW